MRTVRGIIGNTRRTGEEGAEHSMRSVCVFCGSKTGTNPIYRSAAIKLGAEIARRELKLIYGAGNIGLMGVVADAALMHGGHVTGVIPHALMESEVGHLGLTSLQVVDSMHERKARMAELSDAFIAMPGGYGTFEEFCEVLTWVQLGIHHKPCAILNVNGYYDPLIALFDKAVEEGFLKAKNREIVIVGTDPVELLDRLASYEAPETKQLITASES